MIYTANPDSRYGGCWIRVRRFGNSFRAATNDQGAHALINDSPYRDSREEAQADLDALAIEHGWEKVEGRS